MAEVKKFLFDNFVIGGKDKSKNKPADTEAIDSEILPKIPVDNDLVEFEESQSEEETIVEETFSRAELEAKTALAEQQGYDRGYQTASEEQIAENNRLLMDISQKLTILVAQNDEENKVTEEEAAEVIKQGLKAIVPTLLDDNALELINKFLKDNFNNFKHNEKLSFYIHPDIISYVQESIVKLANTNDFEGKIAIHKDKNLAKSSCRVEWDNGGVEYAPQEQLAEIEQMLDKE